MDGESGGAGGCLTGTRNERALNVTRCRTLRLAKGRVQRRLEPKEGEHTAEMGPTALKEAATQPGGRRAGGDVAGVGGGGRTLCTAGRTVGPLAHHTHRLGGFSEITKADARDRAKPRRVCSQRKRKRASEGGRHAAFPAALAATAKARKPLRPSRKRRGGMHPGGGGQCGHVQHCGRPRGPSAQGRQPGGLSSRSRSRGDAAEVVRRQLEEEHAPEA